MRNEAFAFVTVVLVIVSVMAGYYSGDSLNHNATVTTTSYLPISCTTPVSDPTYSGKTQIYQMNPGSVAAICIKFQFASAGNYSFGSDGFPECLSWFGTGCDLRFTEQTIQFDLHHPGQNVTVAYLIQSFKNANGVYWFGSGCGPISIPIDVGPLPTYVEFPGIPQAPCIDLFNGAIRATVTGVTNLNISLVPYL